MFDNHPYNLTNQLTREHKSLWRIKKMYLDDAKDCEPRQKFWQMLEKDKQKHIEDLQKLKKTHLIYEDKEAWPLLLGD